MANFNRYIIVKAGQIPNLHPQLSLSLLCLPTGDVQLLL